MWPAYERLAVVAECSVVCVPWLATDHDAFQLAAFKVRFPLHPVILVTRGDIGNARHVATLGVEQVVWLEEVESELHSAVGRTCMLTHARTLSTALRRAEHLSPCLREALSLTLDSPRALPTVSAVARAAACDRRTLWTQWRATPAATELRLQDFLGWVLLLRAVSAKTPGRSWADVAEDQLGVHPHTLGRLAQRLVGATLRELAGRQSLVASRFEECVLGPLLSPPPADA
ncbi:MAG TPA: hypothetical protein VEY93_01460 [Longimicrobium sp.]|nr:hypothetical protein [Longimicrobium sp.]